MCSVNKQKHLFNLGGLSNILYSQDQLTGYQVVQSDQTRFNAFIYFSVCAKLRESFGRSRAMFRRETDIRLAVMFNTFPHMSNVVVKYPFTFLYAFIPFIPTLY